MNKKITIPVLILVFIVLLVGATMLYNRLSPQLSPEQLGTDASTQQDEPVLTPDFTVYDLAGNPVHLQDFFGKPIVLNFWASWCGPCKSEMPDFQEYHTQLGQEVQFLMVNMTDGSRETVEIASEFISQQGYTFPVYYDTASDAAVTYGVYSLPTTYFINAQGEAIAYITGAISAATLQKGIDMIR